MGREYPVTIHQPQAIVFSAGRKTSRELPKVGYLRRVGIRVEAEINVTGTLTLHEDAPHSILPTIELISGGGVTLRSISAHELSQINAARYGVAQNSNAPGTGVGAQTCNFTVWMDLPLHPRTLVGVVDLRTMTRPEIALTWGQVSDLYTAGAATMTSCNAELMLEIIDPEAVNLDAEAAVYLEQLATTHNIAQAGALRVDVPIGARLVDLWFKARNSTARSSAIITQATMYANTNKPVVDLATDITRDANLAAHGLALPAGYFRVNADELGTSFGNIRAEQLAKLEMVYTAGAPTATADIRQIPGMVRPRPPKW